MPLQRLGQGAGEDGLVTATGVSSSVKMRSEEAMADCSTLNFSDMSLIGR